MKLYPKKPKFPKARVPFRVGPSLIGACITLTNNRLPAAILLSEIVLRSRKGTLVDENKESGWLCISRPQWQYITGLTRHQIDAAISVLKTSGLIKSRRRRLGKEDDAALGWVKLSDQVKSDLAEIQNRPKISAFPESIGHSDSVDADSDPNANSENAESLVLNDNNEKIDKSENVLIGEKNNKIVRNL